MSVSLCFLVFFQFVTFLCSPAIGPVLVCLGCYNRISQTGYLKKRNLFQLILKAGSPKSKCQQIWYPLRTFSLACRWLPSNLSSHGLSFVHTCPWCLSCFLIASYKNTSWISLRPTLGERAHFNLITFLKALSPIYSHSEVLKFRSSVYESEGNISVHNRAIVIVISSVSTLPTSSHPHTPNFSSFLVGPHSCFVC